MTVGDVSSVEDKVLALDLSVTPTAQGPLLCTVHRYSYRVPEDGGRARSDGTAHRQRAGRGKDDATTTPDTAVLGEAIRRRVAKVKEQAVELSDAGKHKEAGQQLSALADSLRASPLANQFGVRRRGRAAVALFRTTGGGSFDSVLRKELRDQSYQAGTRSRGELAQRGTAGGSAASLPTVTEPDGGIALRCEKVSGKLRIRVTADGFDPSKNVQFPRAIRQERRDLSRRCRGAELRRQLLPRAGQDPPPAAPRRVGQRRQQPDPPPAPARPPRPRPPPPTCRPAPGIGTGVPRPVRPRRQKLRARVVSDGYNSTWNIRFPRAA